MCQGVKGNNLLIDSHNAKILDDQIHEYYQWECDSEK